MPIIVPETPGSGTRAVRCPLSSQTHTQQARTQPSKNAKRGGKSAQRKNVPKVVADSRSPCSGVKRLMRKPDPNLEYLRVCWMAESCVREETGGGRLVSGCAIGRATAKRAPSEIVCECALVRPCTVQRAKRFTALWAQGQVPQGPTVHCPAGQTLHCPVGARSNPARPDRALPSGPNASPPRGHQVKFRKARPCTAQRAKRFAAPWVQGQVPEGPTVHCPAGQMLHRSVGARSSSARPDRALPSGRSFTAPCAKRTNTTQVTSGPKNQRRSVAGPSPGLTPGGETVASHASPRSRRP